MMNEVKKLVDEVYELRTRMVKERIFESTIELINEFRRVIMPTRFEIDIIQHTEYFHIYIITRCHIFSFNVLMTGEKERCYFDIKSLKVYGESRESDQIKKIMKSWCSGKINL